MLRIAICDDSREMLKEISSVLNEEFKKYTKDFELLKFSSGEMLLNCHSKESFDIVFLDIDMPEMTGFDIAKALRQEYSSSNIIFVTSHAELVYDTFDFQPFGFIRKNHTVPLKNSLSNIVKKLMFKIKQDENILLEEDMRGKYVVKYRDILYMESDKHYVFYYVYGKDHPIKIRSTIKECEEKFADYDFVKIHRQIIVNLHNVDEINNNDEVVIKRAGKRLPVSRSCKKLLSDKYTMYLRSKI